MSVSIVAEQKQAREGSVMAELERLRVEHALVLRRLNSCHLIIIKQARELSALRQRMPDRKRSSSVPNKLEEERTGEKKRRMSDEPVINKEEGEKRLRLSATQYQVRQQLTRFEQGVMKNRKAAYEFLRDEVVRLKKEQVRTAESMDAVVDAFVERLGVNFVSNFTHKELFDISHDYLFEVMYPYVFHMGDDEEQRNIQMHEKIEVIKLQIKPEMLGLRSEDISQTLVQEASNEFRKLHSIKSPRMKTQVFMSTLECAKRSLIRNHWQRAECRSTLPGSTVPHNNGEP